MKWLIKLEYYDMSFNIKVLKKDDCIINNQKTSNHRMIYILDGFMQKMQKFNNGEIINTQLLYSNDIFIDTQQSVQINDQPNNYFYKFKALTQTTIIVINQKKLLKKIQKEYRLYDYYYNLNQEMLIILSHKNTKKRLIQLLLILIKNFGILSSNKIFVPFNISHNNIANIIGSQRITVNRIMNQLKQTVLYYDNKKIVIFNLIKLIEF